MRPRLTLVLTLLLALSLASAVPAAAWDADFFDDEASGNATYEEMAIQPQAVYDARTDTTHIVYQGYLLDPYIVSYDHRTDEWAGPYAIGSNSLATDTHGAPSMVIDAQGHLVVFWGAHLGQLSHARSKYPGDASAWDDLGPVRVGPQQQTLAATYPQAALDADGSIRLYYRRDGDVPSRGDWESIASTPAASAEFEWTAPESVIDGSIISSAEPTTSGSFWYANVDHDAEHGPAIAAVRRDMLQSESNFYIRKGVYYFERSAEPTWTNAEGADLPWPRDHVSIAATAAVLPELPGTYTNQVVVRRDAEGVPGVLYLAGSHTDDIYEWRFARFDGTGWNHIVIATTDNFFDAGTFEFMDDGTIEAFLTTGGVPDDQWSDNPATALDEGLADDRGGDITWWRSADNGASWGMVKTIIASPGAHARYNDPQIVDGYADGARLIFSEWNNDASNFIHKVFLWGPDGFVQREFTPDIHRLAGDSRIGTAVEISRRGFPSGAGTAVVAAAQDFPDVLCGVPLAHALKAPVLLSNAATLDPVLAEELQRLNVTKVIILGGTSAISPEVENAIKALTNAQGAAIRTERIAGENRYDTSAAIARRLVTLRGRPEKLVLASGANFADALSVSPYAARRGYPVLLTPPDTVSSYTAQAAVELDVRQIIVVGGEAAVTTTVTASYEASAGVLPGVRWGGADRYATAALIAEKALAEGHTLERFAIATGQTFADAVGGGLLMARMNRVVLTTPSAALHPAVTDLLARRAFGPGTGILDIFVLGGPVAVAPGVVDELAAHVSYLDALASQ